MKDLVETVAPYFPMSMKKIDLNCEVGYYALWYMSELISVLHKNKRTDKNKKYWNLIYHMLVGKEFKEFNKSDYFVHKLGIQSGPVGMSLFMLHLDNDMSHVRRTLLKNVALTNKVYLDNKNLTNLNYESALGFVTYLCKIHSDRFVGFGSDTRTEEAFSSYLECQGEWHEKLMKTRSIHKNMPVAYQIETIMIDELLGKHKDTPFGQMLSTAAEAPIDLNLDLESLDLSSITSEVVQNARTIKESRALHDSKGIKPSHSHKKKEKKQKEKMPVLTKDDIENLDETFTVEEEDKEVGSQPGTISLSQIYTGSFAGSHAVQCDSCHFRIVKNREFNFNTVLELLSVSRGISENPQFWSLVPNLENLGRILESNLSEDIILSFIEDPNSNVENECMRLWFEHSTKVMLSTGVCGTKDVRKILAIPDEMNMTEKITKLLNLGEIDPTTSRRVQNIENMVKNLSVHKQSEDSGKQAFAPATLSTIEIHPEVTAILSSQNPEPIASTSSAFSASSASALPTAAKKKVWISKRVNGKLIREQIEV